MDELNCPNGMDFLEGWLYVAETDAIGRIKFDHEKGETVESYERIVTGLPAGGNHWPKTLSFGPDDLMYVTTGSSCNVCEEEDERRATMMRCNPDGSNEEIFAKGLRNSAGFDCSPADRHIYATDNGRDMLGDDFPHCELNKVIQGHHYGWPYANDNKISDPDFGDGNESIVSTSIGPVFKF
jgi:glucose/arabinose dehydrogenase